MHRINEGFTNYKGVEFKNIRDIHYDKKEDLMDNLGTFKAETEKDDGMFFSHGLKVSEGIYLYQSYYDKNTALRIFKEFADYKYLYSTDDRLVSRLQEKQKDIKLTDFPTGIVSIENYVIGQEIPFYEDYKTFANLVLNNQFKELPVGIYIDILKILKELADNGIYYSDVHAKNFMINLETLKVKLIDFETRFISIDDDKKFLYKNMIINLKKMITKINSLYNIDFGNTFNKIDNLDHIQEYVYDKIK